MRYIPRENRRDFLAAEKVNQLDLLGFSTVGTPKNVKKEEDLKCLLFSAKISSNPSTLFEVQQILTCISLTLSIILTLF